MASSDSSVAESSTNSAPRQAPTPATVTLKSQWVVTSHVPTPSSNRTLLESPVPVNDWKLVVRVRSTVDSAWRTSPPACLWPSLLSLPARRGIHEATRASTQDFVAKLTPLLQIWR